MDFCKQQLPCRIRWGMDWDKVTFDFGEEIIGTAKSRNKGGEHVGVGMIMFFLFWEIR